MNEKLKQKNGLKDDDFKPQKQEVTVERIEDIETALVEIAELVTEVIDNG